MNHAQRMSLRVRIGALSFAVITTFAALIINMTGPANAATPAARLFIEDNDFLGPGGSDIQSTLALLNTPGVRVLGFTVATGDGWCDEETNDLLRFLEIARRTDVAVVKGAVFPLVNTPGRMQAWERAYGKIVWKGAFNDAAPGQPWHPLDPYLVHEHPAGNPSTLPAPGNAVDFLIAQVHRYPHQVTIVEAGPMTNLALAIRVDPAFASLAKELVFTGGLIDENLAQATVDANFFSDFNIRFDPEAAHITLTAPWPHIISLGNVTNQTLMTPALLARMAAVRTPVTEFLAKYAPHFPLWDEMGTAVAVDPSLVTKSVDALMDVDLSAGMDYGQTHVWSEAIAPHQGERPVTIVTGVDIKRFYDEFITAAQAPVPTK